MKAADFIPGHQKNMFSVYSPVMQLDLQIEF